MLKKILIGLVCVVILVVVALIFALNPIVERLRPQIVTAISSATKLPIKVEQIHASLFPESGIELKDLKLTDSSKPSSIGSLLLKSDLLNLVRGNITVKQLDLRDLNLELKKTANGDLLMDGMPVLKQKENSKVTDSPDVEDRSSAHQQEKHSASSLSLAIDSGVIRNANLSFTDEGLSKPRVFRASKLNGAFTLSRSAEGTRISPEIDLSSGEFSVSEVINKTAGQIFKATTELLIADSGRVDASHTQLRFGDGSVAGSGFFVPGGAFAVVLSEIHLPLAELAAIVRPIANFSLKGTVQGNLKAEGQSADLRGSQILNQVKGELQLKEISAAIPLKENTSATIPLSNLTGTVELHGPSITAEKLELRLAEQPMFISANARIAEASADLSLESPTLALQPLLQSLGIAQPTLSGLTLSELNIKSTFSPSSLHLDPSSLELLGGKLALSGNVLFPADESSSLTIKGAGFQLSQLGKLLAKDNISGVVTSINLTPKFKARNALNSIESPLALQISDGALAGVNVFAKVMKTLVNIPGIERELSSYLPPQAQAVLTSDSTTFDKLEVDGTLNRSMVDLRQLALIHSVYGLNGGGSLNSSSGNLNLRLQFYLTRSVTDHMLQRQSKLKYLLDGDGRLTFPVSISGTAGDLNVMPDLDQLLKNAARTGVQDAAKKALDKVAPGLGGATKLLDSFFK